MEENRAAAQDRSDTSGVFCERANEMSVKVREVSLQPVLAYINRKSIPLS